MKAKELEWLVNEIIRLHSAQKIERGREEKREENYTEIKNQYRELEKKYNSLCDAYQASLTSHVELQKRYDEVKDSLSFKSNYDE